jgi:hypothetical protein
MAGAKWNKPRIRHRGLLDLIPIGLPRVRAKEITYLTKISILQDLSRRAQWETQARIMVEEGVHHSLIYLLNSPDTSTLKSACTTLGNLAAWRSGYAAIVAADPCKLLVSLSR